MKSPILILFFIILLGILAYIVLFATSARVDLHYPSEAGGLCQENITRTCQVGNCTGLSLCRGGKWGACKLEFVCEPGSRVSCSDVGCVYGFRECDECGSGYGPCR